MNQKRNKPPIGMKNALGKFAQGKQDDSYQRMLKTRKRQRIQMQLELRQYKKVKQAGKLEHIPNVNDKETKLRRNFYDKFYASLNDGNLDSDEGETEPDMLKVVDDDDDSKLPKSVKNQSKDDKRKLNAEKVDRFSKERIRAASKHQSIVDKKKEAELARKKVIENKKKRRKLTRQLNQRTSRGQPVMKYGINNLLEKIKKGKGLPSSS